MTPTDKAMIDISSGGALMNKTPEEAWELMRLWPMLTNILTEGPPRQPDDSQQKPVNHYGIYSYNSHHTDECPPPRFSKGKPRNKGGGEKNGVSTNSTDRNAIEDHQPANPNPITFPYSVTITTSTKPQRRHKCFHSKEGKGEKDEDENEEGSISWWYNLLAQLVDSDDEEDEESKDESEEEDEDESAEEDTEDESAEAEDQTEEEENEDEEEVYNKRTSFIATLFNDKEIKEEVPFTCEDPGLA
ncbi:hypothetical protein PIB30_073250 [Stylosanthes scabra]|uniref:Uncharacterized protein n=1 Tax=Stylosanthes scabra TaxID=79078 RepID=A0ABU6WP76_9FABA|nr:hypothetical protein [Stylosanthes scabra]